MMNPLGLRLSTLAFVVSAFICSVFAIRVLNAQRADLKHQLEAATQGIVDRDRVIDDLQRNAASKEAQQAKLNEATRRVEQQVNQQHQKLTEVIHGHSITRDWANTALPDDIQRLSASPACTGAADYSRSIPEN